MYAICTFVGFIPSRHARLRYRLCDHNVREYKQDMTLSCHFKQESTNPITSFYSLNLQKVDYCEINSYLETNNWVELKSLSTPDEFPELCEVMTSVL